MVAENLHTRLGVRVVSRLETQLVDAHLGEEDLHEANQTTESQTEVGDDTLDLVELSQVGSVDCLITEDTVDTEVASWPGVGGQLVQHVG